MFGSVNAISALRLDGVQEMKSSGGEAYAAELKNVILHAIDKQPVSGFTIPYLCSTYNIRWLELTSVVMALVKDGTMMKLPGEPPVFITEQAKTRILSGTAPNSPLESMALGIIGYDEDEGEDEDEEEDDTIYRDEDTELGYASSYDADKGKHTLYFQWEYDPANHLYVKKAGEIEALIKEVVALHNLLN